MTDFTRIVDSLSVGESGWKVFQYQDNLILKLVFWPVLLSTWLGVTLLRFY